MEFMRWDNARARAAQKPVGGQNGHSGKLIDRAGWLALAVAVCSCSVGLAQTTQDIRIVSYNTQGDVNPPTPTGVLPYLETVIEGIGQQKYVGDSLLQLPDIIALQETTSNSTTVQPIVTALNSYYKSNIFSYSTYQASTSDGTTSGGGPNALIYNQSTLNLIASVGVGTPASTSNGEFRQVVRYEFQPIADEGTTAGIFYVYDQHAKSGSATTKDGSTTDGALRNEEAQIVRNDEATLPANAAVMYVGDFNQDGSTEAAYQTYTAAKSPSGVSQGAGIDPLNPANNYNLTWGSSNVGILTEKDTELEYRDDLQLLTSNIYSDSPGYLNLINSSYHVFGNNGTVGYKASVNATANTAINDINGNSYPGVTPLTTSQVLSAMNGSLGSDHLPIVADYSLLIGATWNAATGGSWNTATNWAVSSIANQSGEVANFVNSIASPATISTDGNWTVGTINIKSAYNYDFEQGGGGSLTLNNGSNPAAINSNQGNNVINVPMTLSSNTTVSVASSSNLSIGGNISGPGGLTLSGSGPLTLSGANSYSGGTVLNNINVQIASAQSLPVGGALSIGTDNSTDLVQIATGAGHVEIGSLAISSTSTLDITNNSLAIDYSDASPAATIRGYIISGRDGGLWNGTGIRSSDAALYTPAVTTVGYKDTGSQILVMYTWIGDTNLDGSVDESDLLAMAPSGTTNATWSEGDFNYDGIVNADDYALFQLGAAYATTNIVNVFPEPTNLAITAFLSMAFLRRNRVQRI
jgi:autotransporter-associated beta strand protein